MSFNPFGNSATWVLLFNLLSLPGFTASIGLFVEPQTKSGDGNKGNASDLKGTKNVRYLKNMVTYQTATWGIINTFAGSIGAFGSGGDGGAATSATLNSPFGVAVDASSNLYVADKSNYYVRVVSGSSGIITAYAGAGVSGSTGDGGAATSALLSSPSGLAVDVTGNLYISDGYMGSNLVRVVTKSTGIIATVAGTGVAGSTGDGGASTSALLHGPLGVAVDASGNVYISDTENNRVRIATKSTGIITAVAGTGVAGTAGDGGPASSALLNRPHAIALDSYGNLYIADHDNHVIRVVAIDTGIIIRYAGNGIWESSGDDGPATSAGLMGPSGVAVDAFSNVYIVDRDANRVRLVTASTGIITTIVGTGAEGTAGDGGPATSALLHMPFGVAIDPYLGLLYVSDDVLSVVKSITYSLPCPPGTASSTGSSPCTACATGTYSVAGATVCTRPSCQPSSQPSKQPSRQPSAVPTASPTPKLALPYVCCTAREHATCTLSCPANTALTAITFASYGNPAGWCGAPERGSCDATASVAVVTAACLNQPTCTVPAANDAFLQDPCSDKPKSLIVTAVCSALPTSQPTVQPSRQPTHQPTSQPTMQPSAQPTTRPSRQPTQQPTTQPTTQPTSQPTMQPTQQPTRLPTQQPTRQPSRQPTMQPTMRPSQQPTAQPSRQPTEQPTTWPSQQPTMQPSEQPTQQPTGQPSRQPSAQPSRQPTEQPTTQPSQQPTQQPSLQPSRQPTIQPSEQPSGQPTQQPSSQPTRVPTGEGRVASTHLPRHLTLYIPTIPGL